MTKRTQHLLSDDDKAAQLRRLVLNTALGGVIQSRLTHGGTTTYNGDRDVYTALGYPGLDNITYGDYFFRFRRQDIAGKIIEKPVEGSWRELPIIRAVDDKNDVWRDKFEILDDQIGLLRSLVRLDKISGIGRYGCLLIGYNDNLEFKDPVEKASKILYLQPFSEGTAKLAEYVTNKNDSRYGKVEMYGLQTASAPGTSGATETLVHHSRILHVIEDPIESEVYGTPRLERAYNRLLNLELIVGGSAEMFWRGAFPGYAFTAKDDADLTQVAAELETEIQKYVHNMERYMKLQGIDVESLAPQVADPANHVDVQLKMIAIATGIPKRILEGSERGELSSSQDSESWDALCDYRRQTHITPNIIRPFIDRLIAVGIIEQPKKGYEIEWPDLSEVSDKERADVGKVQAETWASYANNPASQTMMPVEVFLEEIMNFNYDKVMRMAERINANLEDVLKLEAEAEAQTIKDEADLLKAAGGETTIQ